MPIQIPNDLPAAGVLQQENIFVMTEDRAITQDIRPLEIVVLRAVFDTFSARASTSGQPSRSTLRKTRPVSAGAGITTIVATLPV